MEVKKKKETNKQRKKYKPCCCIYRKYKLNWNIFVICPFSGLHRAKVIQKKTSHMIISIAKYLDRRSLPRMGSLLFQWSGMGEYLAGFDRHREALPKSSH